MNDQKSAKKKGEVQTNLTTGGAAIGTALPIPKKKKVLTDEKTKRESARSGWMGKQRHKQEDLGKELNQRVRGREKLKTDGRKGGW